MKEFQKEVAQWGKDTFGDGQTMSGLKNHLANEVVELHNTGTFDEIADELADCLFLTLAHTGRK